VPLLDIRDETGMRRFPAAAIRTALSERGVDAVTARLTAELALLAFSLGVERWMQGGSFATHATEALRELQSRAADLDQQVTV